LIAGSGALNCVDQTSLGALADLCGGLKCSDTDECEF